ncbi:MAG: ComF family protein [Anaerolineae bacterium]
MTRSSRLLQGFDVVIDLLFPPRCVSCRASSSFFCTDCREKIRRIEPPFCPKCGYPAFNAHSSRCRECEANPLKHLHAIRSVAIFEDGPLKTAIHKFKYQNHQAVSRPLASLLANCYTTNQLNTEVIVPVPLHKSRYRERGYNQSMLLAQELSKLINQPVNQKTLVRHRATRSQMTLKAAERQQNVANAFACGANTLADKTVLLIDDVCTTGATLDACAQALKQANVRAVYGLTLARAL